MFTHELNQLKQRQLALRLRNIELRSNLHVEARALVKPMGWLSAAGGVAGAVMLVAGLRRPGLVSKLLGFTALGLRLTRMLAAWRAKR